MKTYEVKIPDKPTTTIEAVSLLEATLAVLKLYGLSYRYTKFTVKELQSNAN